MSARRYISRFFDTISKESTMQYGKDESTMLNELEEVIRMKREAVESNRRQIEITSRCEQDEILKQVIITNIHTLIIRYFWIDIIINIDKYTIYLIFLLCIETNFELTSIFLFGLLK